MREYAVVSSQPHFVERPPSGVRPKGTGTLQPGRGELLPRPLTRDAVFPRIPACVGPKTNGFGLNVRERVLARKL